MDKSQSIKIEQVDEDLINKLILERNESRSKGDYKKADEIRGKLAAMRVKIKDVWSTAKE